jgi:hypothetical protein
VHVLGGLASAGTISIVVTQAVRLVRIVLDYRVRCKEIELRREQLGLTPGSQPAQAASARHAIRASHARLAESPETGQVACGVFDRDRVQF